MAADAPSFTVAYIVRNRLTVGLSQAHAQSVADLEHDFNPELEGLGSVRRISQGFAHTIHHILSEKYPQVDMVNVSEIYIDSMVELPEIREVEGTLFQKVVIIGAIVDSMAEAVAEVLWKHGKGVSIDEMLRAASAIGESELDQVDAEWEEALQRVRKDFGLTSGEDA